jgi:hypothetical protein
MVQLSRLTTQQTLMTATLIFIQEVQQQFIFTKQLQGEQPEGDKRAPPEHFEPEGHRWSAGGNRVEYMDWSFEFNVLPTSGIHIFDARFRVT